MTKENKLEELRNRKKKLSQEQVAIKMGLYGKREGSARDAISKFENGTTQNWGFLHVIHYANAIEASLDEIAYLLYPDEPYCSSLLAKEEEKTIVEEKTVKDVEKKEEKEATKDLKWDMAQILVSKTLCIGHYGYKRQRVLLSETTKAMRKDKNIFITSSDAVDVEGIKNIAKETGHEVYVFEYPFENLEWQECINNETAIKMLVQSLVFQNTEETDEMWNKEVINVLFSMMQQEISKKTENFKLQNIYRCILDKLGHGNVDKNTKQYLTVAGFMLMPFITIDSVKENKTVRLLDIMQEKHVIIFSDQIHKTHGNMTSLIVEQYIRLISEVNDNSEEGSRKKEYHLIVDGMENVLNLPENKIFSTIATCRRYRLSITAFVSSIEQLKLKSPTYWYNISNNFEKKLFLNNRDTRSNCESYIYGDELHTIIVNEDQVIVVETGSLPHIEEIDEN